MSGKILPKKIRLSPAQGFPKPENKPITTQPQGSVPQYQQGGHQRQKEGMDISDFVAGGLYVVACLVILFMLAQYYWSLHGGSFESFTFWETSNQKWFEILFWALFASIAQNVGLGTYKMSQNDLQKRQILLQFARIVESPFISLALIFVLFNIGISFGDSTISLSKVPVTVIIAFTIITSFFAWETKSALKIVAQWFTSQIKDKLGVDTDTEMEDALG